MKVLVIGAGLGGLALARRLRAAGIEVGVRERDATVAARFQGYRVGLGGAGLAALRGCLPDRLLPLLHAVGGPIDGPGRAVDAELNVLGEMPPPGEDTTAFDRHVLRYLLLAGLEDVVAFGRRFARYAELPDGTVRVHYTDGGTETADVLVGADGMGSAVRRQLLPDVRVHESGRVGAIGRTPMTERFAGLVPGWTTVVNTPRLQMLLGKMAFRRPPGPAAAELAPDVRLPDTPSYLRWVMLVPPDYAAGLPDDVTDPRVGLAVLRDLVRDWHPLLQDLIRQADARNSGIGPLRVADQIRPWPTRRVTLVGDAVHPAPPGGLGASLAFVGAQRLCRALAGAADGEADVIAALADYERHACTASAEAFGQAERVFRTFDELRSRSA